MPTAVGPFGDDATQQAPDFTRGANGPERAIRWAHQMRFVDEWLRGRAQRSWLSLLPRRL